MAHSNHYIKIMELLEQFPVRYRLSGDALLDRIFACLRECPLSTNIEYGTGTPSLSDFAAVSDNELPLMAMKYLVNVCSPDVNFYHHPMWNWFRDTYYKVVI